MPAYSACEKFSLVVQPLLELLRENTDYYIVMLAGKPHPEPEPGREFDLKACVVATLLEFVLI